jgi:RNA polymerase sigma-70 factor (ECF subfamily)
MSPYRRKSTERDGDFVAAWRKGDISSFEALVRKYQGGLLDIAFRLTGSYQEACAVVQDVFASAYKANTFDRGPVRFSSWLVGITLELCRNRPEPARTSSPGRERHGQPTMHDRLQDCIRTLPVEFREAIVLREIHDYAIDEMSAILDVPEGTVKTRLYRSREMMRDCLKQGEKTVPLHEEISRKLSAYLENTLVTDEKEEIKQHLGSCGSCREELANLEWTAGHLKSLSRIEPPPWLAEKIMANVRDGTLLHPGLRRRLSSPARRRLAVGLTALVVISASIYYYLGRSGNLAQTAPFWAPASRKSPPPESRLSSGPTQGTSGFSGMVREETEMLPVLPRNRPEPVIHSPPLPQAAQVPQASQASPAEGPRLQSADEENESEAEGIHLRGGGVSPVFSGGVQREKRVVDRTHATGELDVTLGVDDSATAGAAIEKAVARSGGRITGRAHSGGSDLLYTQIDGQKFSDLLDRLGRIGRMQDRPHLPEGTSGTVDLIIKW